MDGWISIALTIMVPVLSGVIGWLANLSRTVNSLKSDMQKPVTDLKIEMIEKFATRELMRETIEPIQDDIRTVMKVVGRIALKLRVDTDHIDI